MTNEAWPTPTGGPSRDPLPRVEDLPVAEQGYEQESVKAAFDSFYRHAAQLDAALRTLEAVDSFHRQAAALRGDLRALRAAGWTQQPWAATPAYGYGVRAPREGVSPAVWRIAGEVVLLVAVAVVVGVAKLAWWVIVLAMAVAFLFVLVLELAASRERWVGVRAGAPPAHPVVDAEPAADAAEATGWSDEQAQEPSDAMTMIGGPPEPAVAEPREPARPREPPVEPAPADAVEEPLEPAGVPVDTAEPPAPPVEAATPIEGMGGEAPVPGEPRAPEVADEPEAEPEPPEPAGEAPVETAATAAAAPEAPAEAAPPEASRRRRWWRRRREDVGGEALLDVTEPPRHVRVLAADEAAAAQPAGIIESDADGNEAVAADMIDPWERGFDDDEAAGAAMPLAPEPGTSAADDDGRDDAVTADADAPTRRRFRRR